MRSIQFSLLLALCLGHAPAAMAQCNTYTVPHLEDFQSITSNNQLPPCWLATNLGTASLTFTNTGSVSNLAAFYYQPAGTNYFFSPGFLLNAGVVYSVSVWYRVNPAASNGWTDFSILTGPNQTTLGLTTLVSTGGMPAATVWTALSKTLTVGSSGSYYFAISGTSGGSGATQQLMWDDFMIGIPCSLNSPSVTVSASSATLCTGDSVTFYASGADTYSWSNSMTGSSIAIQAGIAGSSNYQVTGTSTLSGCAGMAAVTVTVYPTPGINAFLNPVQVCAGQLISAQAFGASSYLWSTGHTGPNASFTATANGQVTVTGVNQYGCTADGIANYSVFPQPDVKASASRSAICVGESVELSGDGAASYAWAYGSGSANGQTVALSPQVSTTYTLTGTDLNSCSASATVAVTVSGCLGLTGSDRTEKFLYPNPVAGWLQIGGLQDITSLKVMNIAGGEVNVPVRGDGSHLNIDCSELPAGIYFAVITGGGVQTTHKFVVLRP